MCTGPMWGQIAWHLTLLVEANPGNTKGPSLRTDYKAQVPRLQNTSSITEWISALSLHLSKVLEGTMRWTVMNILEHLLIITPHNRCPSGRVH